MADDFSSLADMQVRLSMQDASDSDLSELKGKMAVATAMMIDFMHRDPRLNPYIELCHGHGTAMLAPKQFPINQVSEILVAGVLLDPSRYTFDDFAIYLNGGSFPRGRLNIRLTYAAGHDPAPAVLREAHMIAVTSLWIARDQNPHATGESFPGVNSETWQAEGPGYLPMAARMMIRNYVHPGSVA